MEAEGRGWGPVRLAWVLTSTHNPCFLSRNKENNVYPCKPQFYYVKVGFKGSKLYRYVFLMCLADLCGRRRPRSACTSTQDDQVLIVRQQNCWILQNVIMESKDPDGTLHMRRIIWIWAFCTCSKALSSLVAIHIFFKNFKSKIHVMWKKMACVCYTEVPTCHLTSRDMCMA